MLKIYRKINCENSHGFRTNKYYIQLIIFLHVNFEQLCNEKISKECVQKTVNMVN